MEIAVLVIIGAAAAVAVLQPVFRPPAVEAIDFEGAPATAEARIAALQRIEPELQRYREAVRSGTVCSRCGQANPAGSRFCYECGRRLAAGPATRRA
ncbi:MAG: zinc-ribbon domain-containing protein [Longimicrobiales bacterium]